MNKRGVSSAVVGGILALLVILLMFSLTSPGRTIVNSILGTNTSAFVPESNFTPYTGPPFTDDEVKMINSVNALTCAFNRLAKDKFDIDPTLCKYYGDQSISTSTSISLDAAAESETPAIDTVTGLQTATISGQVGARLAFGESSVICSEPRMTLDIVKPQDADDLADLVIECWRQFERHDFDNVWCDYVDASSVQGVTEADFFKALNNKTGLGDDLAGAEVPPKQIDWGGAECNFNLVGEEYTWESNIGCPIDVGAFIICGNNDGTNEIHLTNDFNTCLPEALGGLNVFADVESAEGLVTKACVVKDFQLPQTIEGDWKDYMRGHGDPTYVMYYEAFPEGEEDAWIVSTQARYFNALMVLHLLPLAGRAISATAKVSSALIKVTGKIGSGLYATRVGQFVARLGIRAGFAAGSRIAQAAAFVRDGVIAGVRLAPGGTYVVENAPLVIDKIRQASTAISNAGSKLNPGKLSQIAEEASSAAASRGVLASWIGRGATVGAADAGPALSRAVGFGGDDLVRALGSGNVDDMFTAAHNVLKVGQKTDTELIAAMKAAGYADDVAEAVVAGAKAQQMNQAAQALLKNPEIAEEVSKFSAKNLATQGGIHSMAYAIAAIQAVIESQNKKFVPIGVNNIGMHRPFETPLTLESSEFFYPLIPEIGQKFVAIKKDTFSRSALAQTFVNQGVNRFFVASPCYADITVKHEMCECVGVSKEIVTHDFGRGPQYVKASTVLSNVSDPYAYAVKECVTPSTTGQLLGRLSTPIVRTACMTAEFDLDESHEQNFCYSGAHIFSNIGKGVVLAATIGTSIAATGALCATGVGCVAAVGVNVLIDLAGKYATEQLDEAQKWPAH